MHQIQIILKRLIKWILFLLVAIIVIRIISLLIPAANPDLYINKAKADLNKESDGKSFFDFPDPGSWGNRSITEPAKVKYLEANFDNNPSINYTPGPSAANNYNRGTTTNSTQINTRSRNQNSNANANTNVNNTQPTPSRPIGDYDDGN